MPSVKTELITSPMTQDALIDYIVTTPNNFNANLFREFLASRYAQEKLKHNYIKKIISSLDSSDPEPLEPSLPVIH